MKHRLLISFLAFSLPAWAADTDGDGLADVVETNTGIYVSQFDTGTDPNQADTDGDGVRDDFEDVMIDATELDLFGCNFLHVQSFQAGSFTDIDTLSIRNLDSNLEVFADGFGVPTPQTWSFRHLESSGVGNPVILDSPLGRIENGMLRLETVGYQQNGTGAYDSVTGASPNFRLPENFEITIVARRNQWAGHFLVKLLPSLQYFYDADPALWAYRVGWAGSNFGQTSLFSAASDTVENVRAASNNLSVGSWHTISIRKLNGTVSLFTDGVLKHSDDLDVFNYTLVGLTQEGIPDLDHDGLGDEYETGTGTYVSPSDTGSKPDDWDSDDDGLSDGVEVFTHGTNPNLKDSDSDGFDDGFEVETGFDPTVDTSTPDALSTLRTAVEFRFNAANGVSYRIEDSTDLNEWNTVETDIIGASAVVTRFYSIENKPKRYFRVRRN